MESTQFVDSLPDDVFLNAINVKYYWEIPEIDEYIKFNNVEPQLPYRDYLKELALYQLEQKRMYKNARYDMKMKQHKELKKNIRVQIGTRELFYIGHKENKVLVKRNKVKGSQ